MNMNFVILPLMPAYPCMDENRDLCDKIREKLIEKDLLTKDEETGIYFQAKTGIVIDVTGSEENPDIQIQTMNIEEIRLYCEEKVRENIEKLKYYTETLSGIII